MSQYSLSPLWLACEMSRLYSSLVSVFSTAQFIGLAMNSSAHAGGTTVQRLCRSNGVSGTIVSQPSPSVYPRFIVFAFPIFTHQSLSLFITEIAVTVCTSNDGESVVIPVLASVQVKQTMPIPFPSGAHVTSKISYCPSH